jgi:hypothetical protein
MNDLIKGKEKYDDTKNDRQNKRVKNTFFE